MNSMTCLDTGFFISRNNVLFFFEVTMVPHSFIEIKDSTCLYGKLGITGEYPGAIMPRLNGVFMKPSPYGAVANSRGYSRLTNISSKVGCRPTGYWHVMNCGNFASQSFNLNDQLWGEKPGADPGGCALQGRPGVAQKIVFATC